MTYEVVYAGDSLANLKGMKVFLGGLCKRTGRDWRADFYEFFENYDITFINPKIDHFPDPDIEPGAHARQVQWERDAIAACDVAIFWLGGGLSNQASRVEIGYALGKHKEVFIGSEDTFLGAEHLTAFSGLMLSRSLEGIMTRVQSHYLMHQK